ncbi:hypothetical protein NIES25_53020 [Nostoc linckia NIES-25]|nr:hypothetical protein NIES25_53020 [Nostoc linckia NIES-25]
MVKLNTMVLILVMSKLRKKQGNPDFRHRVTSPAPTSEEIESRLIELLTPGTFANLKDVKDKERSLRDAYGGLRLRIVTVPMMEFVRKFTYVVGMVKKLT